MPHKDLPSYFVMFGACICIILLVAARHHPPSRQKIKEIWHGRVYWENSSEVSMASPDKPEMPDIKTNLRTTSKEPFNDHEPTIEPINFDKDIENKMSKSMKPFKTEKLSEPHNYAKIHEFLHNVRRAACSKKHVLIGENSKEPDVHICLDNISPPCVVYSFGIANNWIFDDYMISKGCHVYSFDPSMNVGKHKRHKNHLFEPIGIGIKSGVHEGRSTLYGGKTNYGVLTLADMMKRYNNNHVDIIRMDTEYAEWDVLKQWLADDMFSKMDQLLLEIHMWPNRGDHMADNNGFGHSEILHSIPMTLFHEARNKWDGTRIAGDMTRVYEVGFVVTNNKSDQKLQTPKYFFLYSEPRCYAAIPHVIKNALGRYNFNLVFLYSEENKDCLKSMIESDTKLKQWFDNKRLLTIFEKSMDSTQGIYNPNSWNNKLYTSDTFWIRMKKYGDNAINIQSDTIICQNELPELEVDFIGGIAYNELLPSTGIFNKIMNGGLSIRNIDWSIKCIRSVRGRYVEDSLFNKCSRKPVPIWLALSFSSDNGTTKCFTWKNKRVCPWGVHKPWVKAKGAEYKELERNCPDLKTLRSLQKKTTVSRHKNLELVPAVTPRKVETAVPIFVNVFIKNTNDLPRVTSFVQKQLDMKLPEHSPIYVNSIGTRISLADTTTDFYEQGSEMITLRHIWDYCTSNPARKVVYLHSKGSFHANPENDVLREFLTRGALSKECTFMPEECNVCSSRMSPVPHPHTPGNMWTAKCSYISKLMEPTLFKAKMNKLFSGDNSCRGSGRYASEHWVHSHPSVKPCDLYTNPKYVWGYTPVPKGDFVKTLQTVPRFDMTTYIKPQQCGKNGQVLQQRLDEYNYLYQIFPSKDWWGWRLWTPETPVVKYHSSKWEQLWLDNIEEWQATKICKALLSQKEQIHAFMKDTCSATTNTDWCLIDDSVHQVWYNTKNGQTTQRKPSSVTTISTLNGMNPKDDSIWSYFELDDGTREYIEPLVSHLRHPLAQCLFGGTFFVDRSYILPGNPGSSKTFLFDAGASHWSQGAGGPSLSYFAAVWKRYGFDWSRIEGWEGGTTVAKFEATVPQEWRSRTHFHQDWISTSPDKQPFVPDVIRSTASKEDYVVFKLDIDSKSVETAIVDYLLSHPKALGYIDEFIWEQHVDNYLMAPAWAQTQDMTKSIADSYQYFLKLRKLGVRAHSWV